MHRQSTFALREGGASIAARSSDGAPLSGSPPRPRLPLPSDCLRVLPGDRGRFPNFDERLALPTASAAASRRCFSVRPSRSDENVPSAAHEQRRPRTQRAVEVVTPLRSRNSRPIVLTETRRTPDVCLRGPRSRFLVSGTNLSSEEAAKRPFQTPPSASGDDEEASFRCASLSFGGRRLAKVRAARNAFSVGSSARPEGRGRAEKIINGGESIQIMVGPPSTPGILNDFDGAAPEKPPNGHRDVRARIED